MQRATRTWPIAVLGGMLLAGTIAVAPPVGAAPTAASERPCPGGAPPADRFGDDDHSVHETAIACTTWWDLTRGISATSYAPDRPVGRGQAATLVARLLTRSGSTLPASPPDRFPDDQGDAHSFAINRLAAVDVLSGRADGRYAPALVMSRGAMASLLVAAYEEHTGLTAPEGGDRFGDDDGTVHEPAIERAAALGLVRGATPETFEPWAPVTRGQAAAFLARSLAALDDVDATGTEPAALRAATALEPAAGCEGLLGDLKERALESVGPFGVGSFPLPIGQPIADDQNSGGDDGGETPASPAPPSNDGGGDSSGTNNQEAGVDEADIVKVQGTRLVAVNGGTLRVIDAAGGTPVLLSSLRLGADGDHRLLLDGDRLLVLSTTYGGPPVVEPVSDAPVSDALLPGKPIVLLRIVDLSDPAAPAVTDSVRVPGWILGARLLGGVARVVVHSDTNLPSTYPTDNSAAAHAAATARNRELIEATTLADWLPQLLPGSDGSDTEPLLGCDDISAPPEFSGLGFSSVLTVDPDAPLTDLDAVGVQAGSDVVYASPTSLYLTSTRWETWRPAGQGADPTRTDIHAFAIGDAAGAAYLGSGRVQGHLLNQFSLSEHEGVLRVASTTDPAWFDPGSPPGESRVTTLRLSGGALTEVGVITGLGVDERIFGVRFVGDTGYVVTFRQIDPLHVLDLADPANPRVAGELEIPGYSAYLHPIGPGLLLGIGADADAEGRRTGAQVSLFDVADPNAPRRLSHVSLPSSYTDVEYDHLSFLWWGPASRAVIPLSQYERGASGEITSEFTGAVGFSVDPVTGVVEIGRTSHADDRVDPARWVGIRRSLVVGGTLLTLSDVGVEAAELDDLTERAWLPFAP